MWWIGQKPSTRKGYLRSQIEIGIVARSPMGAMHLQRVLVAVVHPGEHALPEFRISGVLRAHRTLCR